MQLLNVIHQLISPKDSTTVISELSKIIQRVTYKKSTLLHRVDTPCHHLHYVESGLLRAYYLKDGKDISCYFANEGKFVTAIDSFFQQTVSQYNVEVIEDAVLYSISYQELEELMNKFPEFERLFRSLLIQSYNELVERLNMLQFYSSKERYENFVEQFPGLSNRLPLGHIASYLGMSQENLSRVRNPD